MVCGVIQPVLEFMWRRLCQPPAMGPPTLNPTSHPLASHTPLSELPKMKTNDSRADDAVTLPRGGV